MPDFIFAYHGGKKPDTPEAGAAMMKKWEDWMSGLGDSLINPGNPVGMSKTVSADGVADNGGPDPLSGFSIVRADTIEEAVKMAQGSPHLEGGRIEVAPLIEM